LRRLSYSAAVAGRQLSRRRVLRAGVGGAAGLAALSLACSGSNNNNSSKTTTNNAPANNAAAKPAASGSAAAVATVGGASTTAAGGAPVRGGTFRFVLQYNITSLDPTYSTNANDPTVYRSLFDSLFAFDATGNLLPYLTDKWEIPGDGLTWTLHLHPGVKFHDGTAFNATAAKFNIDRILDPNNKSPQAGDVAQIASAEAPDDSTLVLKLKAPYSPLGFLLTGRPGFMFSPAAVQKYGADTRTNPVGTGPFVFKEFLSDSHLTGTKNPNYWKMGADGKPLPYYDTINIIVNTDPTAQVALVRSGQAEMLATIDTATAQTLKSDANLVLLKGRTNPSGISLNMNRRDKPGPLNDMRLRQAVALAIDPAAVVKVGLAGDGTVSPPQNFWYPEHWAYYADQYTIKRDLQQAKQLLAAAGQPNGFEFSYIYIKGVSTQTLEIMQANLMDIGVKMTLDPQEVGVFADNNMKGKWDAGGSTGGIYHVDPGPSLRRYYWSESGCAPGGTGVFGGGVFAGSGFNSCQFDQDMVKAEATADVNERKKIYQEMNMLWAQPWHAPKLYLAPSYTLARKSVRNAVLFPDGTPQFHEAWIVPS